VDDREALGAFHLLAESEGIVPALESAHAVAYCLKVASAMPLKSTILVNLSGRGDKDLHIVAEASGLEFFCRASCREATLAYRKTA
jgi:tryptophan synthase beta chain